MVCRGTLIVGLVVASFLFAPHAGAGGTPASSEGGTADWLQVSAGTTHTCGIRVSRRLYCWGSDFYGQLGDGDSSTIRPTPSEVAGGRTDWAMVSAGVTHTCAVRTTGRLYCWGSDGGGQLGNGPVVVDNQTTPRQVGGANWTMVTAGNGHTCGLRATGHLYCWGIDDHGEVGDGGPTAVRHQPTEVAGARTDWTAVDAGDFHTCGRRSSGRLFCWGHDASGQVGNGGGFANIGIPSQVAGAATDWSSVALGSNHTCAMKVNRRIYCWGSDEYGQVGNSLTGNQPGPTAVAGAATDWQGLAAGGHHTCARKTNGGLWCWGADYVGQLGNGGTYTNRSIPTQVTVPAVWTSVTGGGAHTCARTPDRRLWCWGADANEQGGNGSSLANRLSPVQVEP